MPGESVVSMTDTLVGKRIGKYEIIEQLGQGGMARVFKAYHSSLDRHVAIKLMHSFLVEDEGFVGRFQRGFAKGLLTSSIHRLRNQATKLNELDSHFVTLAVTAMIAAGYWLDDDEAGAIKTTVMLRQYADALLVKVRGGVEINHE